uniref:Uncharacterized protein n=1 Tax=Rhizophora mucronata TaxID=61149 RepID=A0A2P2PAJ0_RHIMU
MANGFVLQGRKPQVLQDKKDGWN